VTALESTTEPPHAAGGVRELLAIALPMVVSQACETLMFFVDRLFLARIGPEQMSAAMGGGLTCFMFMTFPLGIIGYANALVAQHLGAGQKERCARAAAQALLLAVATYPLILLCVPAGEWLFRVTGVAAEQLVPQREYFRILMVGTVMALLRNALASFFSGIGRTRVIMVAAAVAMVEHLVRREGLDNVRWLTLWNEPESRGRDHTNGSRLRAFTSRPYRRIHSSSSAERGPASSAARFSSSCARSPGPVRVRCTWGLERQKR